MKSGRRIESKPKTEAAHPRRHSHELDSAEEASVRRRAAPRALVIHDAVRHEGEEELRRPASSLFWSGLAAGLSMGFSLVVEALLAARLPQAPWAELVSKFGYSAGFLIVVLGRQQLFTENTLTPILPLLHRRTTAALIQVVRLWAIVLTANLLGTFLFALALGRTETFEPGMRELFGTLSLHAYGASGAETFLRAVFAGWLIALMVWLLPFAETARVGVIILITYVIGLGGFHHVIAGSVQAAYLVVTGDAGWGLFLTGFLLPTLGGNVLGGVALVAAINHAQVARDATD